MYAVFERGGPLMWPLLVCSLLSVTVTIERVMFWWRIRRRGAGESVDEVFHLTEQGDFEGAASAGRGAAGYVSRVLASGLVHRDHGLVESLQVAAQDEIGLMKRGLGVLDTIVTLAPLLGILGTVLGIIESFDVLAVGGIGEPKAVTGGIAKALITTAAGLSVAIVTLIPYNWLVSAVERATTRLENATTSFEVAYRKGLEKRHETQ